MRKSVLPISFMAVSFLFGANALAATSDLASLDWSVKAPHNLAANPPADDVIKTFMSKLDGVPGYPLGNCYAKFADLHHSNMLSLVVAENDDRFCHLSVVDKTNGGFKRYVFDLSRGVDGPEIKDLGGNGNLELIVPTDLTGDEGANYCMARWPVIYGWTSNGYSDVSSHYKGYYEQQLASLQKEIRTVEAQKEQSELGSGAQTAGLAANAARASSTGEQSADAVVDARTVASATVYGPGGTSGSFGAVLMQPSPEPTPLANPPSDETGLNCTEVEAAKIERFLDISRDAGMSDAIKWANSNDPDDREFAAWIFADIATPEAIRYLRTLSHDPAVGSTGKYALEQANRGPVAHTVDEVSVP